MEDKSTFYFIGVGGIGMSALARYFLMRKKNVMGYDKTPSPLTDELQQEGISISFEDRVDENILALSPETTQVIYTPAVPKENMVLDYFTQKSFNCKKRAEILGILTQSYQGLAVAGTHGKTTTSAILTSIFCEAEQPVNAFLGGILNKQQTNAITYPQADYCIMEADEYDRSFHHLKPHLAIITSVDADHMDVYQTKENIEEAFQIFANQVDQSIIIEEKAAEKLQHKNKITYGYSKRCDYTIGAHKIKNGKFTFPLYLPDATITTITMGLPGIHNILNATAAFIMAEKVGISKEIIEKALKNFTGIRRRFDVHINNTNHVYIDDYAHHPSELDNLIASTKVMFPNRKITLVFQPHLYSRTKDFMEEFSAVLQTVDTLVLLPIYPAREAPIAGITSEKLLSKVKHSNKQLVQRTDLVAHLEKTDNDIVITAGAGDIDRFTNEIAAIYE